VRSVLTTEQQTDFYAATMESAAAAKEDALFSNVSTTASTKPSGMTNDASNQKASKLNGAINITGNKRVGPSIVLKVMAGDTISISTWSWYTGPVQPAATGVSDIVNEVLPLLTGGVAATGGTHGGTIPTGTSDPLLSTALGSFLSNDRPYVSTRPKAFLNWMVVDQEFAGVSSPNHMGALQVPVCNSGDTLKQIVGLNNMVIRRTGWIYIYLSNESAQDVFFDNLVVNLKHGPLIEQKDFYPFGMEIPGLSSQAYKYQYNPNRYNYNGKELQSQEFSDTTGLDDYDYGARMYDPQTARWLQSDPLSEKMRRFSPYNYAADNPVRFIDPDGMRLGAASVITDNVAYDVDHGIKVKSMNDGEPDDPNEGAGDVSKTVNGQEFYFHNGEVVPGGTSSNLPAVVVYAKQLLAAAIDHTFAQNLRGGYRPPPDFDEGNQWIILSADRSGHGYQDQDPSNFNPNKSTTILDFNSDVLQILDIVGGYGERPSLTDQKY
jgi:RHS repeat-associated protein